MLGGSKGKRAGKYGTWAMFGASSCGLYVTVLARMVNVAAVPKPWMPM
jgi:hypothetical protein